jgi:hypothetical protein
MSTIQETIATLKDYNKWRRGDETITMPDPFEVGVAIGDAVRLLSELEIIRSEFEKIMLIAGQKADSNVELRLRAEKAEAENAVFLKRLDSIQKSHFSLSKDNAALRTDKKRLDWLEVSNEWSPYFVNGTWWTVVGNNETGYGSYRDAIDAAMKEDQNESI